jgi:hypothetical protein
MDVMTDKNNNIQVQMKCPICGKPAEKGCIYGGDRKALRWIDGEPSFINNLKTGIGVGKIIGASPLLKGSQIKGVRCASCNKIIVDF